MTKSSEYRIILQALPDWDEFLRRESGLPGPRGNLELAHVVAELGTPEFFHHCLSFTPDRAPTNTPDEFLAFCGALGQGYRLLAGDPAAFPILRACANDPRWRMHEAVAMALQILGDQDMPSAIEIARTFSQGSRLEQRGAAAALCEPRLLKNAPHALATLEILDSITATLPNAADRKSEEYKILRQGLGYCWSVAVAALPTEGKAWIEKWFSNPDPDVRWAMRENLKKNRLERMDAAWVATWKEKILSDSR